MFNRINEVVTSTQSYAYDSRLEQLIGFSKPKRVIANRVCIRKTDAPDCNHLESDIYNYNLFVNNEILIHKHCVSLT